MQPQQITPTGGGSTTFLGLTDTPSSYSGQAGKFAVVNAGETAMEFSGWAINSSGHLIPASTSSKIGTSGSDGLQQLFFANGASGVFVSNTVGASTILTFNKLSVQASGSVQAIELIKPVSSALPSLTMGHNGSSLDYTMNFRANTTYVGRSWVDTLGLPHLIRSQSMTALSGTPELAGPPIVMECAAWKTDATAASQYITFFEQPEGITGTAQATGQLVWSYERNRTGSNFPLFAIHADGYIHHLSSFTVAGAPIPGSAGAVGYCTNGDAGNPCMTWYDGTNWIRMGVANAGSTISAT
jgi:hypothetical protein